MSILIGDYEFDGPYNDVADLQESQGLYAILHLDCDEYKLIHLAQAENIKERIVVSPATSPSPDNSTYVAAFYTPRSGGRERNKIVEKILRHFPEPGNDLLPTDNPLQELNFAV